MSEAPSGWTLDTLYFHLSEMIRAHAAADELAHQAAIVEAAGSSQNGVGERIAAIMLALQQQATFNTQTYLPRAEYTARHDQLVDQIEGLREFQQTARGRGAGQAAAWQYFVGALSVISTIAAIILAVTLIVG